jgi:hypothetical protein
MMCLERIPLTEKHLNYDPFTADMPKRDRRQFPWRWVSIHNGGVIGGGYKRRFWDGA